MRKRQGMILILVLVVISLLSLAGYTFAEMMMAEYEAATLHGRAVQAHALADSGVEAARLFLSQEIDLQTQAGGHYDNPEQFQGILVLVDAMPADRGRFTLLVPTIEEDVVIGLRFGLEDESIRLNLNTLLVADQALENGGRNLLMGLPGMTEDVADAILDWLDPDDETREYGAEIDEYSGLDPPYAPKNGPLETVEELLLVRGVTPWLLFGGDANRNGMIDPHEMVTAEGAELETSDGTMDRGWSAYLTLYSMESNLRPDLTPRININNSDLEALHAELLELGKADWATFIIAYRQNGPYSGSGEAVPAVTVTGNLDLTKPSKATFTAILDLIGAKTQLEIQGTEDPVILDSPFVANPLLMGAYMMDMMDNLSASDNPTIPGRININQAPRTVLLGIPGMTEEIVDNIIADRIPDPASEMPQRRYETWLLSEGLVTLEEMRQMNTFITGGGSVYRAQIVGYYEEGGPSARIEAVIDASGTAPKLMFFRDLSHLGRGYPLEVLGISAADESPLP